MEVIEIHFYIVILYIVVAILIIKQLWTFHLYRNLIKRGKHTMATVIESSVVSSRFRLRTMYSYKLEYMVENERRISEHKTTLKHTDNTAEIIYLPKDPNLIMLVDDMQENITLIRVCTGICVFLLVFNTYLVYNVFSLVNTEKFVNLYSDGTPQEIEFSIQSGANVNAKYERGYTPLMIAAMNNNNPEVIKVLIKAGADINAKFKYTPFNGFTPLMWAIGENNNNNPEVIDALIHAGADVNVKNESGTTPLMIAAIRSNNPEVIKVLIQAGADVNAKNEIGFSPLMWAARINNNTEVLKILIQAGADVNVKDESGTTPLMWAARVNNNTEVLKILIQSGADVNARIEKQDFTQIDDFSLSEYYKLYEGYTLLMLAAKYNNNPEVLSVLIQAGATVSKEALRLAQKNKYLKDSSIIEELQKELDKSKAVEP